MKAFIENNTIFTTSDNNLVPKNTIAIDVPEGTLPQDVIFKDNILRLKTEAEKEDDRKAQERKEAKQELARTDAWMPRISEDIINALLAKFPDLLDSMSLDDKAQIMAKLTMRNTTRSKLK